LVILVVVFLRDLREVAGLGGAAALSRFVESLLFGLHPLDPMTFGGVPALLLVVAAAAVSLPAARATRIEPAITLRQTP